MIINNAASRCSVEFWANHLTSTEENERAELIEIRDLNAGNVREALEDMQRLARQNPRVKNFMHHADFNPRREEDLTDAQRDRAFEIYEEQRGIPKNQPRIVMEHVKNGRKHWHVIWYRLDENGRAFSDSLSAKVAHEAAREIEKELGHEKVIGPYDREQGTPRPPRRDLKPWEMYRGMKTAIDPRDVKAQVTELQQQCAGGIEFQAALERHGYILAQGDRIVAGQRALMIIDPAGNDYHLPRYIAGMNSKQVSEFMRDVDREALPGIKQAQAVQQERKIEGLEADRATLRDEIQWEEALAKAAIAREEKEQRFIAPEDREKETRARREQARTGRQGKEWPLTPPQPERTHWTDFGKAATEAARDDRTENLTGPAAQVWQAWQQSDSATAYAAALDEKGISFARVTQEEADRSHRHAEFAKAAGNHAPRFKEGEIVIVTAPPLEFRRNGEITEPRSRVHKLDQSLAYKFLKGLGNGDKLQGIDATMRASDERAEQRAADWKAIRQEWDAIRQERAAGRLREASMRGTKGPKTVEKAALAAVIKLPGAALEVTGKTLGIFESLFEGIFAAKLTPEQIREGEIAAKERQAEVRDQLDNSNSIAQRAQERQQEEQSEAARQREREIDRGR